MESRGELGEKTRRWIQEKADRDYGGDWSQAAAEVLEGAYARENAPKDPWAEVTARERFRAKARGRGADHTG